MKIIFAIILMSSCFLAYADKSNEEQREEAKAPVHCQDLQETHPEFKKHLDDCLAPVDFSQSSSGKSVVQQ